MENSTSAKKEWFLRSGEKFDPAQYLLLGIKRFAKPFSIKNENQATISEAIVCDRCGGAGGADKWMFTGYSCYKCGGGKIIGYRTSKLYSAEKLEKLNVAREKARAKAEEKRAAKMQAEQAAKEARKDEVKALNEQRYPEAMAVLAQYDGEMEFMLDVREKAFGGEEITENQANAVLKVWAKTVERNDWDAFIETLEMNRQPATTGRVKIEGYVLAAKWHTAAIGYYRVVQSLKLLMIDERGFKVWVSAPKGFSKKLDRDEEGYLVLASAKKHKIAFKATLEPKEGDSYFAFGKRPSKL